MIINMSSGKGKTNVRIVTVAALSDQALTLPYTVVLGFKPAWITSAGYQSTSSGGRSFGEINQNGSYTFINARNSSSPTTYEPYVITSITEDGFQFIKNPTFSGNTYTSFYGSMIVTAGDGKR